MYNHKGALAAYLAKRSRPRFTEKEDRQIKHIIQSEEKRGLSEEEAERRAYGRVVNMKKK
jgi:hypothetical protein